MIVILFLVKNTPYLNKTHALKDLSMITAADEIYIDFSTSCTKDVAVAKLLGWMQGPIRRKYINIEKDGISEEQLPYLHILDEPVANQLLELRKSAQRRLTEAFENDASDEILTELEDKVKYFDSQIHLAAQYFRDIDDELSKGDNSELRIDLESTNKTGVSHIAISTLELWSKKKYSAVAESSSITISPPSAEIGSVVPAGNRPDRKGWLSPTATEGLYLTFAVLIDAFIEMSDPEYIHNPVTPFKKFLHPDKRWIVQTLADFLDDRAAKANNRLNFEGQSAESIKNRIEAASKVKANSFNPKQSTEK